MTVARKSKKTKSASPRRSTRTLERLANVVPHPRYGTEIVPSGRVGDDDVIPGPQPRLVGRFAVSVDDLPIWTELGLAHAIDVDALGVRGTVFCAHCQR